MKTHLFGHFDAFLVSFNADNVWSCFVIRNVYHHIGFLLQFVHYKRKKSTSLGVYAILFWSENSFMEKPQDQKSKLIWHRCEPRDSRKKSSRLLIVPLVLKVISVFLTYRLNLLCQWYVYGISRQRWFRQTPWLTWDPWPDFRGSRGLCRHQPVDLRFWSHHQHPGTRCAPRISIFHLIRWWKIEIKCLKWRRNSDHKFSSEVRRTKVWK